MMIPRGEVIAIIPGDYFTLILPDGSALNVEQTQDDFSIVRETGVVAYTKATSPAARADDAVRGEMNDALEAETTGRN